MVGGAAAVATAEAVMEVAAKVAEEVVAVEAGAEVEAVVEEAVVEELAKQELVEGVTAVGPPEDVVTAVAVMAVGVAEAATVATRVGAVMVLHKLPRP